MSNTRVAPPRRAGKLVDRLEGRAFDPCEGIQDLEIWNGVENLLDHMRTHFEPLEVFRRGRIVYDTRFNILLRRFEGGWTSESFT